MNPILQNMTYQQVVSLALAAGVKLGGGSWTQAFIWGFGAQTVMQWIGWPSNQCIPSNAQTLLQGASQIFQQAVGTPQYDANGNIIDAQYQQVPTAGQ